MNYTLKDAETNMTVFYSKNTGQFELVATGIVEWDIFGERELDYRSYCIRKVLKINNTILSRPFEYKVDLEANKIIKKPIIQENIEIEF